MEVFVGQSVIIKSESVNFCVYGNYAGNLAAIRLDLVLLRTTIRVTQQMKERFDSKKAGFSVRKNPKVTLVFQSFL